MEYVYGESARRWRCFAILLLVLSTCLFLILAVIIVYYEVNRESKYSDDAISLHHWNSEYHSDPEVPFIFHDLTDREIKNLMTYLYGNENFNLREGHEALPNSSYIYYAELQVPNKTQSLEYLIDNRKAPPREATVVLLRGDKTPPVVEEYIVGPLENIKHHRLVVSKHYQKSAPFLYRPVSRIEEREVQRLLKQIDSVAKDILEESYEASFFDCVEHCLVLEYNTVVSPAVSGRDKRLIWYWAHHKVDQFMLHPVDFFILFNLDGSNSGFYSVEKISYAGYDFDSIEDLADAYYAETIRTSYIPSPKMSRGFADIYGPIYPQSNQRSSKLIQPDGPRYVVQHGHVTYLGWDFYFRVSTSSGPQLYNIRYGNNRIAYEISLQEISNFHSGFNPWKRFSNIVYSGLLIGSHARSLVPGVDCPNYASFLDFKHVLEANKEATTNRRSMCLFERNTGSPLRRHFSSVFGESQIYEGLEDIILTLRSIITIYNHDYVIDFNFHLNGAIEVTCSITGSPLVSPYSPQEVRYGFRLNDHFIANVYQTAFHFKVDVDVQGEDNRFQTVDIEPHWIHNGKWSTEKDAKFEQIKISEDLKMTEVQATFKHNSSEPQYFIFHNKIYKTNYKDPSGYRLSFQTGSAQLLSEGFGNEPSISWARYNLAVTKRKEDEGRSSSIFAMWDVKEPIVNFQSYIDDNDSIVDTDLVAWVTLRSIDIPHREDIPTTQTLGKAKSFFLTPFNYFQEDPSLMSRDALVLTKKSRPDVEGDVFVQNYGLPKNFVCKTEDQGQTSEKYFEDKRIFDRK